MTTGYKIVRVTWAGVKFTPDGRPYLEETA